MFRMMMLLLKDNVALWLVSKPMSDFSSLRFLRQGKRMRRWWGKRHQLFRLNLFHLFLCWTNTWWNRSTTKPSWSFEITSNYADHCIRAAPPLSLLIWPRAPWSQSTLLLLLLMLCRSLQSFIEVPTSHLPSFTEVFGSIQRNLSLAHY